MDVRILVWDRSFGCDPAPRSRATCGNISCTENPDTLGYLRIWILVWNRFFQLQSKPEVKSVPRFARLTFLCGQESKQRNPPCRPVVHAAHGRCASQQGISGRHLPVPSGNGAHRARRPSGIRPTCLPGLNGVGEQDQERSARCAGHFLVWPRK